MAGWNRIESTAYLWGIRKKSFHILFLSGILLGEYKIPYRSRIIFRRVSERFDCLIETLHRFQWNHLEIHKYFTECFLFRSKNRDILKYDHSRVTLPDTRFNQVTVKNTLFLITIRLNFVIFLSSTIILNNTHAYENQDSPNTTKM